MGALLCHGNLNDYEQLELIFISPAEQHLLKHIRGVCVRFG